MKKMDYSDVPPLSREWFKKARRAHPEEIEGARKAIENVTGEPRPARMSWRTGRPPKEKSEKYQSINMRLHPKALHWVHVEAKRRGIGYQTFINQLLLKHAA